MIKVYNSSVVTNNLPFAGLRRYDDTTVDNQGNEGNYWSSSPNSATSNNARNLNLNENNVNADNNNRSNGFSVRCFSSPKVSFFLAISKLINIKHSLIGISTCNT